MSTSWTNWIFALATVPFCIAAPVPQPQLPAKEHATVTVPFFFVDGHGSPTSTPTQIDVSVVDNKIPVRSVVGIQDTTDLPLRLGVLIDASGSEGHSGLYQPGAQAISELLTRLLKGPEDRAFIVSFAAIPNGTGFMNREQLLKFRLELTPGGGTAIFDAVYFACKDRMQNDPTQPARRVLVILSDGGDNSSHANQDTAIAAALKAGTVIFAVSTTESSDADLGTIALERLANQTGGYAFVHLNRKDLPKVFSSIREQIENMYAVTFVPGDLGKPDQYHQIKLRMKSDQKVKLRAPKGYYVTGGGP